MYLMQGNACYKRVDSPFQTVNPFPSALPLVAVRWPVSGVLHHNVEGFTDHMTYTREGIPEDAELVDVSLEIGPKPEQTNIVYVYKHPSFEMVPPGQTIPNQRIVLVDVTSVVRATFA